MSPLRNIIPLVGTLSAYQRRWLSRDLLGGLTIVALLVPEGMAYAQLAGLPPQAVFAVAPVALVGYALFGTSRQLVVTVSSTVAVVSASTVSVLAQPTDARYPALMATLALLVGGVLALLGVARLGRLAQFFSPSVLTGFVFGLALIIAVKQIPKILGIPGGGDGFFSRIWQIVIQLPQIQWPTLLVGLSTLAVLLVLKRIAPRIPISLVALIYGIVVASIFQLESEGVKVVGTIPAGLPAPQIPSMTFSDLLALLPGALGVALITFAEAIGPAQTFARTHHYPIDANRELIGLGVANLGAGLFQGFPAGSSLSNSAANNGVGTKTQVALLTAAVVACLVALFLTPLFHNLPEATLGAIVVVAIAGLLDVAEVRRLFELRRTDGVLALVALGGVLVFDILPGLCLAVALSLVLLIVRVSRPRLSFLNRDPEGMALHADTPTAEHAPIAGLVVLRPDEELFFANAQPMQQRILAACVSQTPPIKVVVLDLEETHDLDAPSTDMLRDLHEALSAQEIALWLARIHQPVRARLARCGVIAAIGEEHCYPRTIEAVIAYLETIQPDPTEIRAYLLALTQQVRALLPLWEAQVVDDHAPSLADEFDDLERRLDSVGDQVKPSGR